MGPARSLQGRTVFISPRRRSFEGQAESGLAFCAARWHIAAARYRDCCRVPAALLGRFLPRLGPLAPASGPFFADVFPRAPIRAFLAGRSSDQDRKPPPIGHAPTG